MKAMVYDKKVNIAFTCFLLMPCLVVIFGRNKLADVHYLGQPLRTYRKSIFSN